MAERINPLRDVGGGGERGEGGPVLAVKFSLSSPTFNFRRLLIQDISFLDIRLDWQSFVIIPNDDKLLDLNIYIGEPFPQMENGEEIVCEEEMRSKPFTVTINEHQGERSDIPFSVITKQVVSRLAALRFY